MKRTRLLLGIALSGLLALPAAADVTANYTKQCASCHGTDGKGKTKMGEKLEVRDLTDAKVQATFSDEQALKSISEGIADATTGKIKMPARKDKLTVDEMREIVKLVRDFSGK